MTLKLYDNSYLESLQSFLAKTKQRSYQLLNPQASESIADIGCGVGQDAIQLAKSGAKVYAIDNDKKFISIATQQVVDNLEIEFLCCDADKVPLANNSINKIRFDRVLQHIADHDKVLFEVSRLLKPNGLLQIIDTDYLSISLFLQDEKLERKIIDAVAYKRVPNGHKVRQLPKTLENNNFILLSTEIHNYIINDYEFARWLIRFDRVVEQEVECGNISQSDYEVWQNHTRGQFNLSINLMLFMARQK